MAQLVLTIAGSIIGGPGIGGVIGSAIGGMIGGAIDASLFGKDQVSRGPRLDDLRVQVSTYGSPIPYIFGTVRIAGNVMWSEDLEEVETSTEVGGKGGPSQTVISYSYFATFALLIGFGPVRGIRRIWADTVLVYDATVDGSPPPDFEFIHYRGDETQLADPTIEASLGVGQAPAYRGYSYLVVNRMPLERFGNRIPNFTLEVTGDGEWTTDNTRLGVAAADQPIQGVQRADGKVIRVRNPTGSSTVLELVDATTGEILASETHAHDVNMGGHNNVAYVGPTNEVWVRSTSTTARRYNADTLAFIGDVSGQFGQFAYDPVSSRVFTVNELGAISATTGGSTIVMYSVAFGAATGHYFLLRELAAGVTLEGEAIAESSGALVGQLLGDYEASTWDNKRNQYVVVNGSTLWTVSDTNPPVVTAYPLSASTGGPNRVLYDAGTDALIVLSQVVDLVTVTILDAEDYSVLAQDTSASTDGAWWAFLTPKTPGSAFVQGRYRAWQLDYYGTTVGATVERLALLSDVLTASDIDVSELTQRLRGYTVVAVAPVRGAIEQLAQMYFFDGVEQDDVIYFRRRGGASVATVTRDDCGAGIDQRAEVGLEDTRAQELELPRRFSLTAPDPIADHQPGTQYAERLARQAGEEATTSVAVVLTATENRRIALAHLFDAWASRYRIPFSTHREFSRLVPTDVVTIDGRRARIVSKTDEGGLLKFEAVTDDAEVQDQTALGVQGEFPDQVVAAVVPTTMVMLDIALLRDSEDYPGMYVAAYGVPPSWRGAQIFSSSDDGVTWSRLATMPKPGSAIGGATNALGNFFGGNTFDEHNSLNISLSNGSASSTTRLGVLNGGNALAIESNGGAYWEILQYRDVILEGDGTYTLTGLLRGRRGTEYATAGHAIGDRVVLLDTSTIRDIEIDSSIIGVERPYRPVSIGGTINSTPEQDVTINAERLECWSPVLLGGGRNASGDVLLNWTRRTRVGGEWRDGVDAQLGESSEEYAVEIFTSSSRTVVARTISGLTSETATYTAAQQTSDFGSLQAVVYWRVYQLSAVVGRGHGADGTT